MYLNVQSIALCCVALHDVVLHHVALARTVLHYGELDQENGLVLFTVEFRFVHLVTSCHVLES
jgi:hypothetical protein